MAAIAKLIDCAYTEFKIKDNRVETNKLQAILYRANRNNLYSAICQVFLYFKRIVGFITPTLLYNLCNKFDGQAETNFYSNQASWQCSWP